MKQIDYFSEVIESNEFYHEVQFHLGEENFEAGTDILTEGDTCKAIYIIVQGQVEITTSNSDDGETHITFLKQGDIIGQYSPLFDE